MKKALIKIGEWNKTLVPILLGLIFSLISYIYITGMGRVDKAIDSINAYHKEHQEKEQIQNNRITKVEFDVIRNKEDIQENKEEISTIPVRKRGE